MTHIFSRTRYATQTLLFAVVLLVVSTTPALASDWKRAETHSFVVYSEGSTSQLEKYARDLERLDALLRKLWRKDPIENPAKLTVYLLEDAQNVSALAGRDARSGLIAGFYTARAEGSFFVGNRRRSKFAERLTGRQVLYHEYAHHFFFQNFSIPAPAWFAEGYADFVSTAEFLPNEQWTIGKYANRHLSTLAYNRSYDFGALLSGAKPKKNASLFYAWSWALTHYLYSQPQGSGKKITRYLADLNDGIEPEEAAANAFGDREALAKAVRAYIKEPITYQKSTEPLIYRSNVQIEELQDVPSQLVELRLQRLMNYDVKGAQNDLEKLVDRGKANADVWSELAILRYVRQDRRDAQDAVESALSLDPAHTEALVLRGRIAVEKFQEEGAENNALLETGLADLEAAVAAEPNNPWALINLAQTLQMSGQQADRLAELSERAFELAPEVVPIRFQYAFVLTAQGQYSRAIQLMEIIANNPHGGGENAEKFIESLKGLRDEYGDEK